MLNKSMLIGNLGSAPSLRFTQAGVPVMNLDICTVEQWFKDNEYHEKKEWHKIVMFGDNATRYAEKLNKGDMIYVEGKAQTRGWEDKDGNKRTTTEVIVRQLRRLVIRNSEVAPDQHDEVPPAPEPVMGDDVPF